MNSQNNVFNRATAVFILMTAAAVCAGNAGCAKHYPVGISFVKEMGYVPEVDSWDKCVPGAHAQDSQNAAQKWNSVRVWVEKQYAAGTVRALSGWAKEQMKTYKKTPKLGSVTFAPIRVREDHKKLVLEGVVEKLPVHSPAVTRYLKLYILYDISSGEIVTVTLTIRGTLEE